MPFKAPNASSLPPLPDMRAASVPDMMLHDAAQRSRHGLQWPPARIGAERLQWHGGRFSAADNDVSGAATDCELQGAGFLGRPGGATVVKLLCNAGYSARSRLPGLRSHCTSENLRKGILCRVLACKSERACRLSLVVRPVNMGSRIGGRGRAALTRNASAIIPSSEPCGRRCLHKPQCSVGAVPMPAQCRRMCLCM